MGRTLSFRHITSGWLCLHAFSAGLLSCTLKKEGRRTSFAFSGHFFSSSGGQGQGREGKEEDWDRGRQAFRGSVAQCHALATPATLPATTFMPSLLLSIFHCFLFTHFLLPATLSGSFGRTSVNLTDRHYAGARMPRAACKNMPWFGIFLTYKPFHCHALLPPSLPPHHLPTHPPFSLPACLLFSLPSHCILHTFLHCPTTAFLPPYLTLPFPACLPFPCLSRCFSHFGPHCLPAACTSLPFHFLCCLCCPSALPHYPTPFLHFMGGWFW